MLIIPTLLNYTLLSWASNAIVNVAFNSMLSQTKLLSDDLIYHEWMYDMNESFMKAAPAIIKDNMKQYNRLKDKNAKESSKYIQSTLTELELKFLEIAIKRMDQEKVSTSRKVKR